MNIDELSRHNHSIPIQYLRSQITRKNETKTGSRLARVWWKNSNNETKKLPIVHIQTLCIKFTERLYSLYCTFRYNFRFNVLFKVLEHLYTITLLPTTASYGNMVCDNVYKVTCIQSIHKHIQNIFSSRWLHFPFSHKVKTWAYKLFNLVRLLNGKSWAQ